MSGAGPHALTLRAYNVGFGDCFLLTFHYDDGKRRVLIDFGSSAPPARNTDDDYMLRVAENIREECEGKLHAVVATHRHRDHVSGFAVPGTGEIIAALQPDLVVQPWTEDPQAQPDAVAAAATTYTHAAPDARAFVASLHSMHAAAAAIAGEAEHVGLGKKSSEQLRFLGEQNVANAPAVRNLMEMGRRARAAYVHCGSESGLDVVLPGVKTYVLGPPDLEQTDAIRKERSRDPDEFWHFQAFWRLQAAAGNSSMTGALLFPHAAVYHESDMPANVRWLVERTRRMRGEQLMELVRELDRAMNNTSVILLFEVNGTRLLFPGDAQIENWAYALAQPAYRELLQDVLVYKVGHHGSLNATPKSLWELFARKGEEESAGRLCTVLSTRPGKHGNPQSNTEVPRRTLVAELQRESDFFSTQNLSRLYKDFEFNLRGDTICRTAEAT